MRSDFERCWEEEGRRKRLGYVRFDNGTYDCVIRMMEMRDMQSCLLYLTAFVFDILFVV